MVHDAADRFVVAFDDKRVVANAGVMLPALLASRLGIEALVGRPRRSGDRPGAANAGRKVMTMLSAMALGADCIEDCDVLRAGQTTAVLGHRVSGALDDRHVLARVHVRACASARAGCSRKA